MQPKSRHSNSLTSAAWLAAGAAAGLIVGVALADRSRAARAIGHRLKGLLRTVRRLAGSAEREMSEPGSNAEDDDLDHHLDHHLDADADADFDADFDDDVVDDSDDDEGDDAIPEEESPRLDARVLAAYEQDPILSRRAIKIDSPAGGTIVLTGRVPSERDVAHAVTIARGTPGVEHVETRLRVRPPRRRASGTETGA